MKALTIALAMALLLSIGLNVAVRRSQVVTRPPLEYFPDMVRTPRYNAFEANPNFADGMTLRTPPPGTIPRGMLPLASEPGGGGEDPENPFGPDDPAAVERGAVMFDTFCVPCHGKTGEGDGLVVQHGYPAPPSLTSPGTRGMVDAEIFAAITNGLGTMPSYGAQIARDDRWKAILHLRKLQAASQPAEPPPGGPR
ncbi:MAG: cytochrome c [Luteitalea sp.]|nr:cytochrome c [Luteitalea sp.]